MALTAMLEREFQPTDLTVSEAATPVFTGGDETDIFYYWTTLPPGYLGITWCDDAVDASRCDQHYVALAMGIPQMPLDPTDYTLCHESGHAVGLTHGAQAYKSASNVDPELACLRTGLLVYPTLGVLGPLNEIQIDATY
jgi:hypothetical protein